MCYATNEHEKLIITIIIIIIIIIMCFSKPLGILDTEDKK